MNDNAIFSPSPVTPEPIAIVGIGCRLPGGAISPERLWELLCKGVDAVGDIPAERWDPDRFYSPTAQTPGRMSSRRAGCLDDVTSFDGDFFGIVPRVADQMDPQQRILLEVTWEGLEDAGIPPTGLAGTRTGVYVGVCSHDYGDIQSAPCELEGLDAHSATGNFMSIVANRLSYTLDLRGPSMVVDTACSSSLVAVHLACNALRQGECDLAVAGGVNVMLSPHFPVSLSQATMLSPDGFSRAFDASANGYVRGEGAGVVVLKRYSEALRDKDRIYALIRGSAVNQDGRTPGITVPGGDAQEANALAALEQAGIAPSQVGYLEAHGTGTPVGDPIEADALGRVINADGKRGPERRAFMGSIKTNIGHLEAGAGIAGLIKATLVVQRRAIPPSLHFEVPNPQIDFQARRLAVPTKVEAWPSGYDRAIAGVNSFGFGGTNAHVVIEEPPSPPVPDPRPAASAGAPRLLAFSARSEEALRALAEGWADWLERQGEAVSVDAVAQFLALRRSHHDHRLGVVAATPAEAAASLRCYLENGQAPGVTTGHKRSGTRRKLAFLFNGQGPQWWAMGRKLLETEPVFADVVRECDRLARPFIDWSILDELTAAEDRSHVNATYALQPTMFALQMGLVALWRSWGVEPEGVVGHSLGDITAACVAGIIDLSTALQIICNRSRIQDKANPEGGMLYATLPAAEAEEICVQHPDALWLSAINGPRAVTFSGGRSLLATIQEDLQARGVFARILRVNCACHSPHMDPLHDELLGCIADTRAREGTLPFYSTVSGQRMSGKDISPAYWWSNFRKPVMFHGAIDTLLDEGFDTLIELSPHPVLLQTLHDIFKERGVDGRALHSLRRNEDDHRNLLGSLSALYTAGFEIDWRRLYPKPAGQLDAPRNPWIRAPYWIESKAGKDARTKPQSHPMIRRTDEAIPTWEARWDDHRVAWIKEHHVFGGAVVPAAAYLEMILAATAELGGRPAALENIEFERPCVLAEGEPMLTRVLLFPESATFEVHSRPVRGETWTRHVRGRYWAEDPAAAPVGERRRFDLEAIRARCKRRHGPAEIYDLMARKGYVYGPSFCGIKRYHVGDKEGLARVEPPLLVQDKLDGHLFHPVLLDACFQSAILHPARDYGREDLLHFSYLPTGMDQVRVYGEAKFPLFCYTRVRHIGPEGFSVDLYLLNDEGEVVAEFSPLTGTRVHESSARGDRLEDQLYTFAWKAQESGDAAPATFAIGPEELRARLEAEASDLSRALGRARYHEEYAPQVAKLCSRYITRCLRDLGVDLAPGATIRANQIPGVQTTFRRFLEQCLSILGEDGVLRREGNAWTVARAPEDADPDALFRELAERFSECHPELMVLRRTGPALAHVLRGAQDPLALLFPRGDHEATEPLYHTSPISRVYNLLVRRAVEELVASADPERPLRILEVGAGTGGLTAHVLPSLPADRARYHFTDVSPAFLRAAEEKFGGYGFLRFDTFDVEQDPESQGLKLGAYDIILASDVIHATSDLSASVAGLQSLLAPGGVLALIEAMPGNRWLHLTFGLTEGWWRFQDFNLRRSGPLLPPEAWLDLLRQADFEGAVALRDAPRGETSGQFVLLARAPAAPAKDASKAWAGGPARAGRWLILGDQGGLGNQLAKEIQRRGGEAVTLRALLGDPRDSRAEGPGDPGAIRPSDAAALREIAASAPWEGVIHLWSLDQDVEAPSPSALEESVIAGSLSLTHLLAGLSKDRNGRSEGEKAKVFVVTRGAQPIQNATVSLGQAPLWGLSLVCGLEMPEIHCRMIDLPSRPLDGEARALWQELWRDDDEREVALRGSERLVRRLRRLPAEQRLGLSSSREVLARGGAFALSAGSAPTLDKLRYVEAARRAPGSGQVEVEIRAADLNFLDVMTALGQVPRLDPHASGFGGECAGVVTRVGPGVEAFAPGDEVLVVRGELGAVASHLTTDAVYVFHKPKCLDFEEASELPIAFLTAWYTLHKLARVEPGERVLIHSATGGTGLACVQVARLLGAEVYATAGNDEKRDYLRALGVQHVASSRSLAFADEIMRLTAGRGVDVVINSLVGDAAARGVACLAPYGRFVEIGKRDFLSDRSLGLRPFLKNLSYLSFDLRALLADQPKRVREDFKRLLELFEEGTLRPLPRRVFHAEQAPAALRQMTRAGHIGKLTLAMRESPVTVTRRPEDVVAAPRGTWLLAGGLGGFGLQMAEDLARRGARHLVLLGRSVEAAQKERAQRIEQETGARVIAAAVDIADRSQLERLLRQMEDMPPLKGVVHCAMVLDDRVLTSLTEEALREVVRPKLLGAFHLHELTAGMDLDAFVLFSSMTSMMGNQGQGNYAVANTFLDALAHHRKARGLPVTCVSWGVIADAGYVARHEGLKEKLAAIGAHGIGTAEAVELLLGLTRGSHAHIGAFRIDWRRYAQAALYEGAKRHPRYEELMVADDAGGAASALEETAVLAQLHKHAKGERASFLAERLRKRVALVLGLAAEKLDLGRPLTEYLDSLLVVEVVSWMEKEFGVKYTLMDIMKGPSVTQLAADILGRIEAAV